MFTIRDFLNDYRTVPNEELLTVLNRYEKDYQPAAIEAAKKELARRELSPEELNEATRIVQESKSLKTKRQEKIIAIETQIKTRGVSLLETLNPVSTAKPTNEKIILSITLLFAFISIYHIVTNHSWTVIYVRDFNRTPFYAINAVFPLVTLPVATIAFWGRKKIGWILLTAYLTYSSLWTLRFFERSFQPHHYGIKALDNLIQRPSPTSFIIPCIFYIASLCLIARPSMRETFTVNKNTMIRTIAISWVLTFILILT